MEAPSSGVAKLVVFDNPRVLTCFQLLTEFPPLVELEIELSIRLVDRGRLWFFITWFFSMLMAEPACSLFNSFNLSEWIREVLIRAPLYLPKFCLDWLFRFFSRLRTASGLYLNNVTQHYNKIINCFSWSVFWIKSRRVDLSTVRSAQIFVMRINEVVKKGILSTWFESSQLNWLLLVFYQK